MLIRVVKLCDERVIFLQFLNTIHSGHSIASVIANAS